MTRTSIYLRPDTWDLALDSSGSIASCVAPYELAQSAACAARTFAGELFYQTNIGVPYWTQVLGHDPSPSLFAALIEKEVLRDPLLVAANVVITQITDRTLTGQIFVTDQVGNVTSAYF